GGDAGVRQVHDTVGQVVVGLTAQAIHDGFEAPELGVVDDGQGCRGSHEKRFLKDGWRSRGGQTQPSAPSRAPAQINQISRILVRHTSTATTARKSRARGWVASGGASTQPVASSRPTVTGIMPA